jgi:hypothetical protein
LTKQKGSFEGDVAIIDLRERMAGKPDQPPEPPLRDDCGSAFGMVGRLGGLVTMVAVAACGFASTSTPQPVNSGFALAAYEKPAAGEEPGAAPALNNTGVNAASAKRAQGSETKKVAERPQSRHIGGHLPCATCIRRPKANKRSRIVTRHERSNRQHAATARDISGLRGLRRSMSG